MRDCKRKRDLAERCDAPANAQLKGVISSLADVDRRVVEPNDRSAWRGAFPALPRRDDRGPADGRWNPCCAWSAKWRR